MIARFIHIVLPILLLFPLWGAAQENPPKQGYDKDLFTVGAGVGFQSFIGDMSPENEVDLLTNIRPGYSLSFDRRFGKIIGVGIQGLYGSVAKSHTSPTPELNRNFRSDIFYGGIEIQGHFDNEYIINRQSPFSPFISVGVGFLSFDPYGDLEDKNGDRYHYWEDGSIRNKPQSPDVDKDSTRVLYRDHTYETQLKDSAVDYSRNTLSIPLTFGLKWKINDKVHGRFNASYMLNQTDWIDNHKENGDKDKFLRASFSLHYRIVKRVKSEQELKFEKVDFEALSQEDSDNDSVPDIDDECPNTVAEAQVDKNGCPVDSDNDGVPDHKDKEPNSPEGARVDKVGVTLTDERIAELEAREDSLMTVRSKAFSEDPDMQELTEFTTERNIGPGSSDEKEKDSMPEKFKPADFNGDDNISSDEITKAIDKFFDGEMGMDVQDIYDLIDYFFEQ